MSTATPPIEPLLYTPEEAAKALRIGRSTVYELMAEGALPYTKRGRSRRIKRCDLEAYVMDLPHEAIHAS
ncbi:helix-turn-helix domain-containing protein [Streptomyces sp. ISL-11]|uniref:helix-turn-helix domain-containing protein n=1 Tax=Streptomyces sp. ISL-11 TaxID=2819174 RepID=UPI001BE54852|nr:helix-turn-helix domain-containing protein [Streptomyces sp. ISL-11]MBT2383016.1 helix-turn-helix domain-containing protein [Streptomyces sp. ISL-11]